MCTFESKNRVWKSLFTSSLKHHQPRLTDTTITYVMVALSPHQCCTETSITGVLCICWAVAHRAHKRLPINVSFWWAWIFLCVLSLLCHVSSVKNAIIKSQLLSLNNSKITIPLKAQTSSYLSLQKFSKPYSAVT